ncbi:MAG: hypothetical protein J6K92_03905 [Oscillospiraceae bacterium]|nr:hypothetical protein [Oscillospiraceae bacterium]
MADRAYGKFFLVTMIKLSFFLILCEAANYFSLRLVPAPFNKLIPPLAAAVITWFFLTVIERNSCSFFAKGYFLQNVIIGGLWGFGAAVAGPLVALAFNVRQFNWFADCDITKIMLDSAASGLFLAIVVFGYFYHILISDFGAIPAIIISSLIFGLLSAVEVLSGVVAHDILLPAAAYYAIIGTAAGMLILGMGDMRSAAAFLFAHQVMSQVCEAFTTGGKNFETDLGAPIMAVLCAFSMFLEIRREKKEKKEFLNY